MSLGVPRMPTLDTALQGRYAAAHAALAADLASAAPPLARLWRRWTVDLMCSSLATIDPTWRGGDVPLLFPPPRRFLSRADEARLGGVRAAFRHVDSRIAMVRLGHDDRAVRPETPFVLHALTEGRTDNPKESNPGMIRAGHVEPISKTFSYMDASLCRATLDEALAVGTDPARGPAAARAAWLLLTANAIHPFLDGNGRVARFLYLLVASEDLPAGLDWNVAEQMRHHRETFTVGNFGMDVRSYDPDHIDAQPFTTWLTERSIDGADLGRRRLSTLAELATAFDAATEIEVRAPLAAVSVVLRRAAGIATIAGDIGTDQETAFDIVSSLTATTLLRRIPRPVSMPSWESAPIFTLAPEMVAVASSALSV